MLSLFLSLRQAGVKTSLSEYLTLTEALKQGLVVADREAFYHLARTCLVKNESQFDRFDQAFKAYFDGIDALPGLPENIPAEWLQQQFQRLFTDEEKAKIEALGGLDKLMETLEERLKEQKEAHRGGNKWIGTGGTSPFGHGGFNPEGIRMGGKGGGKSAVKVWEQRAYQNLDEDLEINNRNLKVALRRLRKFTREGAPDIFDLDGTIQGTAHNAGLLDIRFQPERKNRVKVLLFFDIGGSMDPHIKVCEELFSAAKTEFKYLEFYYFHNFIYESVWKDNYRRQSERTDLFTLFNKFSSDYRVIFVGDATMGPYEISHPGGSVEHWNEEAGATWMERVRKHFPKTVWLNPEKPDYWSYTPSIQLVNQLLGEDRMFPLTIKGLEAAMRKLSQS